MSTHFKLNLSLYLGLFLIFQINSFAQVSENTQVELGINKIFDLMDSGDYVATRIAAFSFLNTQTLDCKQSGRVHKIIALTYSRSYDYINAIKHFKDSTLTIWNSCTDLPIKYLIEPNLEITECYTQLKNFNKTVEYGNKVSQLYHSLNDESYKPLFRIRNTIALAHAYSILGDKLLAEKYYDQAEFYIEQQDVSTSFSYKCFLFNTRSIHYKDYNEFEKATKELLKGLEVLRQKAKYEKKSMQFEDEFIFRGNLAQNYLKLGQIDLAKKEIEYITDHKDKIITNDFKAQFTLILLEFYHQTNQIDEARKVIRLSEESFKNLDVAMQGRFSLIKGKTLNLIDQKKSSIEELNLGINKLVSSSNIDFTINDIQLKDKPIYNYEVLFNILSEAYYQLKDTYLANNKEKDLIRLVNIFNEIDYLVQTVRFSYNSELSQINQLERIYSLYEDMISTLLISNTQRSNEMALGFCIKNKSNILKSKKEIRDYFKSTINEELLSKTIEIDHKLLDLESKLISSKTSEAIKLNKEYLRNVNEKTILQKQIETELRHQGKTQFVNQPYSITDISKQLDQDQLLLEIFYGKQSIYLFGIHNSEVFTKIFHKNEEMEAIIKRISESLMTEGNLNVLKNDLSILYNNLYKPLIDHFGETVKHITIVTDGLLHNIPFETLYDGHRFMIERYDINYLFSTNDVCIKTSENKLGSYYGFGTKYSSNLNQNLSKYYSIKNLMLSNLSKAEKEINASSKIMDGQSYEGTFATLQNFISNIQKIKGTLHLALHGLILNENESAIIFDDSKDSTFLLSSNDVYKMDLQNELSILSACYSADGKIYAGEGVRSLARAFQFAGSRNIISSSWAASDEANQKIITSFFMYLKQSNNLTQSLSKAKRDFIKSATPSQRHPSNWGNMQLFGLGHNRHKMNYLWFVLGGFITLLSFVLFTTFRKKAN